MSNFEQTKAQLRVTPRRWLVTGAAGFIGSNLAELLVNLGQQVVGLDNFATGKKRNLEAINAATCSSSGTFQFIEGDIRDLETCQHAASGADIVLHQAALGSVPRSIKDPITTNAANITGFLNMLVAARDAGVKRFVYAASSSTYGDHPQLPKVEDRIGRPLSPYAVTKYVNELYADVFSRTYGMQTIGLRYFNVFGRRQDPDGAYAAVIPRWIGRMLAGQRCVINGDGETSRDFCYIENVAQANLLAGTTEELDAVNQVYNVAVGDRTTLAELHDYIRSCLAMYDPSIGTHEAEYVAFRDGDVRHSQADIRKAARLLGYRPTHRVQQGLAEAVDWYVRNERERVGAADPAESTKPSQS